MRYSKEMAETILGRIDELKLGQDGFDDEYNVINDPLLIQLRDLQNAIANDCDLIGEDAYVLSFLIQCLFVATMDGEEVSARALQKYNEFTGLS